MISFNINTNKLVLFFRNKYLVYANTLLLVNAIVEHSFGYILTKLKAWKHEVTEREKWTFEVLSMEKMLNDEFDPLERSIKFQTLNDNSIHFLSGLYDVESSYITAHDAPPEQMYYIPNVAAANRSVGITYDFVVYCRLAVFNASRNQIEQRVNYYKYSGMQWFLKLDNDIINPEFGE